MMFLSKKIRALIAAGDSFFLAGLMSSCGSDSASTSGATEFLNVSFDPTRELYAAYNEKFHEHWTKEIGNGDVTLTQSYGGNGKQARAVIEGLLML